jgi:ion channel-forming bestrophin family protein
MVTYNPREWFRLIFQFHKSDTFRILFPTMLLLGAFTVLACYIEKRYFRLQVPTLTIFHQVAGFVVSMVLVFRINSAYDRWWEGRKNWGSLVNHSRSLAMRLKIIIGNDAVKRQHFAVLIPAFAAALKSHLRDEPLATFPGEASFKHKPNQVLTALTSECAAVCNGGPASNEYLLLSENLHAFADICGACERIRNTPIPYSYSLFIKKMIFVYVITMPVFFGFTLGYWAVPMVMIIFYAFASLEIISEEIEDPFGTDSNDLPLEDITERIQHNITEILR